MPKVIIRRSTFYCHVTSRNFTRTYYFLYTTKIRQTTFVTIQQGRYVESGKFSAWLTRIAHNLIIDKYRQDKNANLISNDNDECDIFNNAALSDITVEMKIIKEQSLADVERLVKELPAVQQEVVYMRFYQNLSFKEIAEATGVSINTALGRMRYGLINLRRMVEERGIVLTLY